MNVITLKLINGDEIIGREVSSSTNKITMTKVFLPPSDMERGYLSQSSGLQL